MNVYLLPYSQDLFSFYTHFADLPGFVLLESLDRCRGQYDILTACPRAECICYPQDCPDTYLHQLEMMMPPKKQILGDLPFQGGLIGYFTYHFGEKMMGLPVKTDEPLARFRFYDWAIVVDHVQQRVVLWCDRAEGEQDFLNEMRHRWYQKIDRQYEATLTQAFGSILPQEGYYRAFNAVQEALASGRVYQANLTQAFHARYTGNPLGLYRTMRSVNPVPYAAFIQDTPYSVISFSPERFMMGNRDILSASPIKGTCKRYSDKTRDREAQNTLLACPKNRAENIMIVDLWRNDLSRIAQTGSVSVDTLCALESYHSLHHLVSTVRAHCDPCLSQIQALASCFPAASITGAPKRESMRVIHELEKHARGIYTGSLAYFSVHGRCDSSITIRTMAAYDSGLLELCAGGGIVIDSQPTEEYQESLLKIKPFLDALMQK